MSQILPRNFSGMLFVLEPILLNVLSDVEYYKLTHSKVSYIKKYIIYLHLI